MAWPNKKPASGIPAGGKGSGPASGIPATGMGWGGEAKGKGTDKTVALFEQGSVTQYGVNKARQIRDDERAEEMKELIYGVATKPDQTDAMKLMAANSLLNRIEGLPVSRNLNMNLNGAEAMTDDELDARAETLEKRIARFDGRTISETGEEEV